MRNKLTLAQVRAALRPYGATVTRTDGEYRVYVSGATYFTDDAHDAIGTGIAMRRQHTEAPRYVTHETAPVGNDWQTVTLSTPIRVF